MSRDIVLRYQKNRDNDFSADSGRRAIARAAQSAAPLEMPPGSLFLRQSRAVFPASTCETRMISSMIFVFQHVGYKTAPIP